MDLNQKNVKPKYLITGAIGITLLLFSETGWTRKITYIFRTSPKRNGTVVRIYFVFVSFAMIIVRILCDYSHKYIIPIMVRLTRQHEVRIMCDVFQRFLTFNGGIFYDFNYIFRYFMTNHVNHVWSITLSKKSHLCTIITIWHYYKKVSYF